MNAQTSYSNISVLIAEDEENIALAIRAIVKKVFDITKLSIAGNGHEALSYIEKRHYDVIISDWNMPGMTGKELLEHIRNSEDNANTPFLMLTARADKHSVIEAIKAGANDYLAKPYKKDQLLEKVEKLLEIAKARENDIDDLIESQQTGYFESQEDILEYITERIKNGKIELPVLPNIYNAVSRAMEKEDVGINDIVSIVKADPSISTALITISNSPLYRGSTPFETIDKAINRIGLEATKHYVFMIEGRYLFQSEDAKFKKIMDKLWEHSLATAICAREIGLSLNYSQCDSLFAIGLMHDIGKLPLIKILMELSQTRTDIDDELIYKVLDSMHAQLGSILLAQWHFPENTINLVKHHHDEDSIATGSIELHMIHLADMLVKSIGFCINGTINLEAQDTFSAITLGLDEEQIVRLLEQTKKHFDEIMKKY